MKAASSCVAWRASRIGPNPSFLRSHPGNPKLRLRNPRRRRARTSISARHPGEYVDEHILVSAPARRDRKCASAYCRSDSWISPRIVTARPIRPSRQTVQFHRWGCADDQWAFGGTKAASGLPTQQPGRMSSLTCRARQPAMVSSGCGWRSDHRPGSSSAPAACLLRARRIEFTPAPTAEAFPAQSAILRRGRDIKVVVALAGLSAYQAP